ncbi:MAG TPA: ROK family transcriptional regulator [Pseudolysinimonas sp.]
MAVEHLVSEDVRRHNLSLVLTQVVRSGPSARSELARATGLTQGAVSALTKSLVESGILRELEPVGIAKGRPLTKLAIAADGIAVLAVQLSADDVTALATALDGDDLFRAARSHGRPMGDAPAVLDVLAEVVREALERATQLSRRIAALTVVVLAPVGGDPARVLGDVALGWGEVDVVAELVRRVPELSSGLIVLASDTPIAARAELRSVGGRDAIYLKADSNIGGAIVVGGAVVGGAHGFGGSLGHLSVVPGGALCECGQHGCLVTVAGIESLLAAEGGRASWDPRAPSAALESFVGRVQNGESDAVAAWERALPWISRALQVLVMATDPAVIIIAGHWARLRESIERAFLANRPDIARDGEFSPVVVAGTLGVDAALRGAIWEARERLILEPAGLAS